MKKIMISLLTLALLVAVTPAFVSAHEDGDRERRASLKIQADFDGFRFGHDKFVLTGTVASVNSTSLVLNVKSGKHMHDLAPSGQVTIALNSDSTIIGSDKNSLTITGIKAGDKVVVSGTTEGSVLTAVKLWDLSQPPTKAYGKVTAVSSTSITLQNSVTGQSQTVAVNEDTKVNVNGESKTIADVNVGDSGWVKFKNVAGTFVARIINLFR